MQSRTLNVASSGSVNYLRTPARPKQPSCPGRPFDPLAAIVWMILIPASAVAGWYGFYRLLWWLF